MLDVPHVWQQAAGKAFVYALNEDGVNEFSFLVQSKSEEKAVDVATLACAAPALLEALEKVTQALKTVCENCQWQESDFPEIKKAKAAIAAARGETK